MAQDWFYKLLGEETGPISFTALRDLAQEGHLESDDEVRTSTSSWKRVNEVPSLYSPGETEEPELATDMDLDLLLAPSSSQPIRVSAKRQAQLAAIAAAAKPTAEWYYKLLGQEMGPVTSDEIIQQIKDGLLHENDTVRCGREGTWQTLDKTPQFAAIVAQMQPQPEWYCRVLGQVLGPMIFDELQRMAKTRSLNPDDEVRHGATEPWVKADRTRGLKFPRAEAVTAATSSQSSTLAPFGEAAKKREWYYEIVGQIMGPISFVEMAKGVADGTLKMEDKARRGKSAAWSLVMDIPGLVSMEGKAAYLAAKAEASRPKPVAPTPPPSPVAAAPRVALPTPESVPVVAVAPPFEPPRAASSGYGATGSSASAYGASGAGASYGSISSASRPAGFPPSFKPPKKSGGGSSANIGELLKGLKEKVDAKAMGAIAVILLVGGYFGMSAMGISFGSTPGLAEYNEIKPIWIEVQKLQKDKSAKPDDRATLSKKYKSKLKKLEKQINDQGPGSARRLLQLMYFCTKNHLPELIEKGDPARYTAMEKDMKEAAKLAGPAKKKKK